MSGINIETIMEEIRKEAKELQYEAPVAFEDVSVPAVSANTGENGKFDRARLGEVLQKLNASWHIAYDHPLVGNKARQQVVRVIRKANRPVGAPIADEVSAFNADVVQGLNEIANYIAGAEKRIAEAEKRVALLEDELRVLKRGKENKA